MKCYDFLMEVVFDKVIMEVLLDFDGVVKEFLIFLDIDVFIGIVVMMLEIEEIIEEIEVVILVLVKEVSVE